MLGVKEYNKQKGKETMKFNETWEKEATVENLPEENCWTQIEFSQEELKEIDDCIQVERIGLLDRVLSYLWTKINQIFQTREKKIYEVRELWSDSLHVVRAHSFEEALEITGLSPMDVFSAKIYD